MTATYQIIGMQSSDHEDPVAFETYQVRDHDGKTYLPQETAHFSIARDRYCELTGENPSEVDYVHARELDGIELTEIDD